VIHGRTGLIVETIDEMTAAIGEITAIAARECREHVVKHYQRSRMGRDYEQIYEAILHPVMEQERTAALTPPPATVPAI